VKYRTTVQVPLRKEWIFENRNWKSSSILSIVEYTYDDNCDVNQLYNKTWVTLECQYVYISLDFQTFSFLAK